MPGQQGGGGGRGGGGGGQKRQQQRGRGGGGQRSGGGQRGGGQGQQQGKRRPQSAPAASAEPEPPPTPELLRRIAKQVEFYFSDGNLVKDAFLQKQMAADPLNEGWVSVATIASFAKMKSMSTNIEVVKDAVAEKTKLLRLNDGRTMLSRVTPIDPDLLTEQVRLSLFPLRRIREAYPSPPAPPPLAS